MTKLLVSVRSAAEARLAVAAGVHLIDVKEPSRGSLGAADAETVQAIADVVPHATPLSVALGELSLALGELSEDRRPAGRVFDALAVRLQKLPQNVRYAKLGLAGMATRSDWSADWRTAVQLLPAHVTPVAVAYADARLADAPSVNAVWREGRRLGCGALLIDTYHKRGQTLLDWLSVDELTAMRRQVHQDGGLLVLAGSLTLAEIERLLPLRPDYVAVRGAACAPNDGRTGSICADALTRLMAALSAGQSAAVVRQ